MVQVASDPGFICFFIIDLDMERAGRSLEISRDMSTMETSDDRIVSCMI